MPYRALTHDKDLRHRTAAPAPSHSAPSPASAGRNARSDSQTLAQAPRRPNLPAYAAAAERRYRLSPELLGLFATISDRMVAMLHFGGDTHFVGTLPPNEIGFSALHRLFAPLKTLSAHQGEVRIWSPKPRDAALLKEVMPVGRGKVLCLASLATGEGKRDWLLLELSPPQMADAASLLGLAWQVVRNTFRQELYGNAHCEVWQWYQKALDVGGDVAVLGVDRGGRVLFRNAAADQELAQRHWIWLNGKEQLCAAEGHVPQLRRLLDGLHCPDGAAKDHILVLERSDDPIRVPLYLDRHEIEDTGEACVIVTLPRPPERHRIERVARALGLTQSESRVAALVQLGLTNKAAAAASGLKEQTLATYVKRILGKLNLNSRSELISLLAWQAAGGTRG